MKISDRGYWVSKIFYYQSLIYYFYYSLRFRSFTFFSASNPLVDLGGMLGEKKTDIYELIPKDQLPVSVICTKESDYHSALTGAGLKFPIIGKPNIGYKGFLVGKLENQSQLTSYMEQTKGEEIILQEYISLPHEYSLLYHRMPYSNESGISSLIEKIYPFVMGDGSATLRQLIHNYKNPFLDRVWVLEKCKHVLNQIPSKGEKIVLDPIGNYSRGAKFYSLNHKIDDELVKANDKFFQQIKGMDFGRIDMKAGSLEDVKLGHFKVLEINGAKSEPLHIYDPKESFISILKSVHKHWVILAKIVRERKEHAFDFPSTSSGLKSLQNLKKLTKS